MTKIEVTLTDSAKKKVRSAAKKSKVSMSEWIRQAITAKMART